MGTPIRQTPHQNKNTLLLLTFYKRDISLRLTHTCSASATGVLIRESCLYHYDIILFLTAVDTLMDEHPQDTKRCLLLELATYGNVKIQSLYRG